MEGVARDLPELQVEYIGRDDLLVAALPVLLADEGDQLVIYARAVWQPEAAARREVVEEEELLLVAQRAVVALLGLFLELLPLLQQALLGEGYTIHALQGVVGHLAQPVRGRGLHSGERL